jgi:hypothetical protein
VDRLRAVHFLAIQAFAIAEGNEMLCATPSPGIIPAQGIFGWIMGGELFACQIV